MVDAVGADAPNDTEANLTAAVDGFLAWGAVDGYTGKQFAFCFF